MTGSLYLDAGGLDPGLLIERHEDGRMEITESSPAHLPRLHQGLHLPPQLQQGGRARLLLSCGSPTPDT